MMLEMFKISPMLALQTTFIGVNHDRLYIVEFPEGIETYNQLLNEPFVFDTWLKEKVTPYLY